jgi:nitronate monooxygenase
MAAPALAALLGTELPVIQAPMAGVQGSALALAVSRAGGLGSLPCAMLGPEAIRGELARLRDGTDRPFAVNFFCHRPPAPDARREQTWRAALAPYAAEAGIDLETAPPGAGRAPFSEALCELIEPFRPPVVSFHFGLPAPALLARVRAWGAVVLSSATTVEEARWLEAHGADAVIAQGLEAGGHRGHFLGADADVSPQQGLFALLPRLARAVRVPVIAAGGIAGPQEAAAARALGAAGVQAGTAYLLCPEASTPALHRAALREAAAPGPTAAGTALTNVFTGRPARGLVNRLVRERGPMSAEAPAFPVAAAVLAPLRAAAEAQGRADFTPLWAGCRADACREIPAAELTRLLGAGWA